MKIPKQIKIGATIWKVEHVSAVSGKLAGDLGTCYPAQSLIRVYTEGPKDRQEEALLHEIIEAINSLYDCDLEHKVLATITMTLYQVLKDNKLYFGRK